MSKIFISYRRSDAAAYAGRLYDRLRARFGEEHVFMDIDKIEPGEDFAQVIQNTLKEANAVIVVIGKHWLSAAEASGKRRLDDPRDFVHMEIVAALEGKELRVVPILVGGALMPSADDLPAPLKGLVRFQAQRISDERWDFDVEELVRALGAPRRRARHALIAIGVFAIATLAGAAVWFFPGLSSKTTPTSQTQLRATPRILSIAQAKAMVASKGFYDFNWNPTGGAASPKLETKVIGEAIVVEDRAHGRTWQQTASRIPMHRALAEDYVRKLNQQRYAGFSDWRLPTLEEALSVMEPMREKDCHLSPALGRSAFVVMTADRTQPDHDWVVYYCDGIAAAERSGFAAHVRAVR